jgi:hypothetical protein
MAPGSNGGGCDGQAGVTGTKIGDLHLGHLPFFPAASSAVRKASPHLAHVNFTGFSLPGIPPFLFPRRTAHNAR